MSTYFEYMAQRTAPTLTLDIFKGYMNSFRRNFSSPGYQPREGDTVDLPDMLVGEPTANGRQWDVATIDRELVELRAQKDIAEQEQDFNLTEYLYQSIQTLEQMREVLNGHQ